MVPKWQHRYRLHRPDAGIGGGPAVAHARPRVSPALLQQLESEIHLLGGLRHPGDVGRDHVPEFLGRLAQ